MALIVGEFGVVQFVNGLLIVVRCDEVDSEVLPGDLLLAF